MLMAESSWETTGGAVPRLTIAGAGSGVGKTTLTTGLLAALRARGLEVQPFKAGPDYIDPTYHTLAAGRPCRNLDAWMLDPAALLASFARAVRGAQLAIVEGVMGLYDGFGYEDEEGSTAHLAKLLDSPVVVVLNAASMGRSAGAQALGYARYDAGVRIAGFIANNVGSCAHGEGVTHAINAATGMPCFGWVPRAPGLVIPERHLGLIPTAEPGAWEAFVEAAGAHVSRYLDMDGLVALAVRQVHPLPGPLVPEATEGASHRQATCGVPPGPRPLIAVARDEAFSFYYQDNLEALEAAGAELAAFSPLCAAALPRGCSGLYLGGGFPEMYAAGLAGNETLRGEVRSAIETGMPAYAECGGLMYLTGSLTDAGGAVYPMVGALPGQSIMTGRLTMGYRTVTACRDTFLMPAGATVRGHEFHYSDWVDRPAGMPEAYMAVGRRGDAALPEGYAGSNLVASYVHLHFGAAPYLAERIVAACRAWAGRRPDDKGADA
jgi:cobyrinic acid a,c-diamide synthase